jgi:hypothetical protein
MRWQCTTDDSLNSQPNNMYKYKYYCTNCTVLSPTDTNDRGMGSSYDVDDRNNNNIIIVLIVADFDSLIIIIIITILG